MNAPIEGAGRRRRLSRLEILALTGLGLLAVQLAIAFPSARQEPALWRDRDYAVYYQAYQLFGRGPEDLSVSELHAVKRWSRCLWLVDKQQSSGVQSLTDEECEFVVEVLDDMCPDTDQFTRYRPIYESCLQSLDRRQGAIAANGELRPSHDRSVLVQ